MAEAHDGTGSGLDLFLEWAARTGELNPSTANSLRTAAGKVLKCSEEEDGTDVTRADVESLLARWENLNRTKYSAGSLQTYKSRFRMSVAMYKAWLLQDPGWKAAGRSAASVASRNGGTAAVGGRVRKGPRPSATAPRPTAEESPSTPDAGVRMVAYDMPLRPELLVRLTLPVDLTDSDAARISTFVKSLAFASTAPSGTPTAGHDQGG